MKKFAVGVMTVAGAAALTVGAAPGMARTFAPGVSGQDATYMSTSIQGDRFEVKAAKLAFRNSDDPAVQHVAKIVRRDHAKSLDEAVAEAKQLGIPVPGGPSPTERWELRVISNDTGSEFDGRYISLEIQDHKQDIDEAVGETKWGSSVQVRDDAQAELPTLQKHLALFKELKHR